MIKIRRLPLVYPPCPGDVSPSEFKAEIRRLHQDYCNNMSAIEATTEEICRQNEQSYEDAVTEYMNSIGE